MDTIKQQDCLSVNPYPLLPLYPHFTAIKDLSFRVYFGLEQQEHRLLHNLNQKNMIHIKKRHSWLNIFAILFSFTTFMSCVKREETTYNPPIFPTHTHLKVTDLNHDYLFRYAYRTVVYDSLLIVATLDERHYICIFNRYTGELITEFGKKGNGPTELITPTEYSIDKAKGILYVNDYGKQGILCYDLNKIGTDKMSFIDRIKYKHKFRQKNNILFLKDSLFISSDDSCHFIIADSHTIRQEINSEIPDEEKFPMQKDWNVFMNDYACHAASPDGTKYVVGSMFGGIMETFEMTNGQMKHSATKLFYKPLFMRKGHVYRDVKNTIGGFSYIAVTDSYIYATVHGTVNPQCMPTQIWKLDWHGNPIECFHCNGFPIDCFTIVEDENIIYAICTDQDGEQYIAKMEFEHDTN